MIEIEEFFSNLAGKNFFVLEKEDKYKFLIVPDYNFYYLTKLSKITYMNDFGTIHEYIPNIENFNDELWDMNMFDSLLYSGIFTFDNEEEAMYFKMKFCS